ncbi:MAG: DNA topoisomerase (ATP-hydrolyzing) subunit B [Candidatus Nealsonbacteria bacterium]
MPKKNIKVVQVKKVPPAKPKESSYGAKDIYVLEGLDPVRKRPGMYIGSTGPEGLHHLVWECIDNSLDEAMAGYAKNIEVVLMPNNRVKTTDDGRGIPVERHAQTKKSALETVMTTLHAGGKFGGEAYKISGGLHGVGVSVVCALSKWMRAEVCREGVRYFQEYAKGIVKTKVIKMGGCKSTGTSILFEPDPEIFKEIKFSLKKILEHLRQQAYLTSGVRINVIDSRTPEGGSYSFYFEGGLKSYIKFLVKGSVSTQENVFYTTGEKENILVEAAFQYSQEREAYEESFANNINTGEGGSHLTGFRTALTRSLNDYARKNGFIKNNDENLTGEDVREGFVGVVSIKIREPQFEGQTKAKLGNPEAKPAVEAVVSEGLTDFLERNPQDARAILEKCLLTAKARKAAKAARQTVLRKGILDGLALPGKLSDCSSKNAEESELFIVEGDSAGGCFSGETEVALTDGRNLSFKQLVSEDKQGKKNYCYTVEKDGSIGVESIENPRITKSNVAVIKVVLDNGEEIVCTPDHKFMLRDGSYQKAENLTSQDSLMPLRRQLSRLGKYITIKDYELVYDNKENRWIFTHFLADSHNIKNGIYSDEDGSHKHHIDFNKLNNNPDNLRRMSKEEHMKYHSQMLVFSLHREDVKEKVKRIHQSKEYREKISRIMSTPKMRELLSKRAKKQWENEEYKQYMVQKFTEFYKDNKEYREKSQARLNEAQTKYWSDLNNRRKRSEEVRSYFREHPEKIKELSEKAKKEWQDQNLLAWRKQKTKDQWTSEFRVKRKKTYNQTYQEKGLKIMKDIFDRHGKLDVEEYNLERLKLKDRSLLKYDTICQRFFGNDEKRLEEAVINYNHRINKIVKLREKINVYDLEVNKTHNFALASGIFVHNSARQGRNRRFQAILPLRGKILNVERARLDKILLSKEIKALIIAMGTAIADDFDIEKLRYHRVIIMTDADTDGSHIRTLLLTFFYRYFQPIIEKGYLYIAQPPLYRIQAGKSFEYAYTEADRTEILSSMQKEKKLNPSIQRYKGLGEMNPDQLWETTMSPENRILLQVTVENAREADHIFDTLMGDDVLPRKKFIQAHAKKVKNLDI